MDDYISRREFVEQKERQYCQNCDRRKNSKGQVVYSIGEAPCRACGIGDVLDDVVDFPAADVQPVLHARWIDFEDGSMCSGCGASHDGVNRNYCPNCGAKMGGTP